MTNNPIADMFRNYSNFMGSNSKDNLKKRRLEEILNYDLDVGFYDNAIPTKIFRPDIYKARQEYKLDNEMAMPYTTFGEQFADAKLQIPAFGKDNVEEISGKFDLITNTLTKFWDDSCAPLEHNKLLFHFNGIDKVPYSKGECQPAINLMKDVIEMNMYEKNKSCRLMDGRKVYGEDLETDIRMLKHVDESFRSQLVDKNVEPIATLIPFNVLQKHISDSNKILESQYGKSMRNSPMRQLKQSVIERHGSDSVVSAMLHMNSPEMFYETFIPRGICSSIATGKNVPYSNGKAYSGIITIQTTGILHVDVEDGTSDYFTGDILDTAYLYLIIEMKELIPNDTKFNYPWIRMLLTPKTTQQVENDILINTRGICKRTRDGMLSKTLIKPIGKLSVGPYHVRDQSDKDGKQFAEFDIIMLYRSGMLHTISFQM